MKILIELGKGDIPEYPSVGVTKDLQIGTNLGLVGIPFIIRELREIFATDDTMVNFAVDDVEIDATAFFVKFQVESFYNLTYNDSFRV